MSATEAIRSAITIIEFDTVMEVLVYQEEAKKVDVCFFAIIDIEFNTVMEVLVYQEEVVSGGGAVQWPGPKEAHCRLPRRHGAPDLEEESARFCQGKQVPGQGSRVASRSAAEDPNGAHLVATGSAPDLEEESARFCQGNNEPP